MGRPTGGSHRSSHSSSSHRSSSHHSSSHRVSTSSRPMRSSGSSYSSSSRSSYSSPRRSYGRSYSTTYYGGYSQATSNMVVIVSIIFILFFLFVMVSANAKSSVKSTIQRTKLSGVIAYDNDNIIDEVGWVEYKNKTSKDLKAFYDETGVQPYIYLKAYTSELSNDDDREDWADDYFDSMEFEENAFVFFYFAERNENDMGLMYACYGDDAALIFDGEAMDIFWNYMDSAWNNSSLSMDEVFVNSFVKTGSAIMSVSKTGSDVAFVFIVFLGIVVFFVSVIIILKIKVKRAREKAEEDERILNTKLDDISTSDPLVDKYTRN